MVALRFSGAISDVAPGRPQGPPLQSFYRRAHLTGVRRQNAAADRAIAHFNNRKTLF
ncbi:hypothetical protein SBA2_310030 [Acidobacteriia bacterium SbA2]|nr:hypothetical protein SBA2_310030 [Acidobacteriia bacterium SbA2]